MSMINSIPRRGFSLMELMIVVSILGVLAVLTLVGIQSLDDASMHSLDMTNQRSIARATLQHTADNKGLLLHPRTAPVSNNDFSSFANDDWFIVDNSEIPDLIKNVNDRLWVRAYDETGVDRLFTVDPGQPAEQKIERPEALSHGAAWQYMDGNIEVYKSPLDTTPRTRSYSLNCFVGPVLAADDIYARWSWNDPFYGNFVKYAVPCPTMGHVKQPGNTFCSITEDDPGHNGGTPPGHNLLGFLLHPNQEPGFSNYQIWHDLPGFWDPTRMNMSYMDGSVRPFKFTEPDLARELDTDGDGLPNHRAVFDGTDLRQLQKMLLPGVLEYRSADDQP